MAFFPVDDDTSAFEAALSFVDEYEPELGALQWGSEGPMLTMQGQDALMSTSSDSKSVGECLVNTASLPEDDGHASSPIAQAAECKAPGADKDKKRRRQEINERKKLLRKAGVYADPNRVRKERTREIASLRQQMEKLQIDLEALKSGKNLQPTAGSLVLTGSGMQGSSMWKELAERQRHRRETSEHYNVRLRVAVERQRKVADNLSRLLEKRTSQVVNECSPLVNLGYAEPHVVHVLDYRGDVGEFQGLFRRLDTAYHELDAVFESNGLARMEISPNDVHMREDVGGKYLEFFTHKTLPFGVNDTAETAWEHFKGVKKHMGYSSLYEKTAKDLDKPYTIVEDFTKEVYSNNARADVSVKQVVRRFVEKDRDVVIWVSRAVPVEIRHKMLRGLAYHFRGYAITKRSPASTPERELSQLQLCSLLSLDQDGDSTFDPANLRALTNFLIVHAAQNIRAHRELIENALVDRSLRHRLR